MTNPDSIVRVHSRNGGRASVLETNQWAQVYNQGILVGNGVSASTGLTVEVGGSTGSPDVLIAETPAGYKVSLDVVGSTTLTLTAPASNSKIVAIVAYTDDLSIQSTEDTMTGSPSTCGLLAVDGTIAANPSQPTDAQIRTAITDDGATGSQAAYAIIALVTLSSDTTDLTDSLIHNQNSSSNTAISLYPTSTTDILCARDAVGNELSLEFTATTDCIIEAIATTGYRWGYAGRTMSYTINATGTTEITKLNGALTGGDQIGRQLQAQYLGRATEGSTVKLETSMGGAQGGATDGSILVVKVHKLMEVA